LQVLEDGTLTDAKGRQIDFKNTILIMTSNIGAKRLTQSAAPIGFNLTVSEMEQAESAYEKMKDNVLDDLKKHFRPEFLNRIDKTVVFKPLSHENVKKIVGLHVDKLQERVSDKQIQLKLTVAALEKLADLSFSTEYGARPVRRQIQELVEDPLTQLYLDGEIIDGDTVNIELIENKITLVKQSKQVVVEKKKTARVSKK